MTATPYVIDWDAVEASEDPRLRELRLRSDDVRKEFMREAWAKFERDRDSTLAYGLPEIQGDAGGYFLVWPVIGFAR